MSFKRNTRNTRQKKIYSDLHFGEVLGSEELTLGIYVDDKHVFGVKEEESTSAEKLFVKVNLSNSIASASAIDFSALSTLVRDNLVKDERLKQEGDIEKAELDLGLHFDEEEGGNVISQKF